MRHEGLKRREAAGLRREERKVSSLKSHASGLKPVFSCPRLVRENKKRPFFVEKPQAPATM
jgi:hypothetical protein